MKAESNLKYCLAFIHPISNQYVFLAYNADIKAICYSESPTLLGTTIPEYAKLYSSIDSVKSDIYMLRYHHRCFLNIPCAIISICVPEQCYIINKDVITEYDTQEFIIPERTDEITIYS